MAREFSSAKLCLATFSLAMPQCARATILGARLLDTNNKNTVCVFN